MNRHGRYIAICVLASIAWLGAGIGTEGSHAQAAQVQAGLVDGHPYLANEAVAFLWAKPEDGAGLVSIYDRRRGHEFLAKGATSAPLWQVLVKTAGEQRSYQSAGMPCTVSTETHRGVGKVALRWAEPLAVQVEAQLAEDSSQVRMTITVRTAQPDESLLSVTFPVVSGILPLTREGRYDKVLEPFRLGWIKPSPAVTGKALAMSYPGIWAGSGVGMSVQFTALLGGGRGLYVAEEDEDGNQKRFVWQPEAAGHNLGLSLSHPVLGWGGPQPVREYRISGPVVLGPFEGDWFDAARIYRKWALTAPWCAKGPIYERADYPRWFARLPYWTIGHLSDESGIERELVKREFFKLPNVCHDYGYHNQLYQHDRCPEYFPPRLGSENYARVVRELQSKGTRVVPYVMGWLWNMTTESYRTENAEQRAAILGESGGVIWTWAGGLEPLAAMCPASTLWREKLVGVSQELVGRYGVDGIYFDYFTVHTTDCFNPDHGHPLGGGNYWTRGVHGLYEQVRTQCQKLNPEVMLCGEDAAEWCIDVLDASYEAGPYMDAPVYLAVYHGYTQVFGGGLTNKYSPPYIGRYWLMGAQAGDTNQAYAMARPTDEYYEKVGPYYRNLIRCRSEFGLPYLGYGEMLRPPRIYGDLPTITSPGGYGPFTLKAVDGSAWLAPDGTVGIFFLNYDETPHQFTWSEDLSEIAGIGPSQRVRVTRWSGDKGIQPVGQWQGGLVRKTMQIDGWGLIALKLEVER